MVSGWKLLNGMNNVFGKWKSSLFNGIPWNVL